MFMLVDSDVNDADGTKMLYCVEWTQYIIRPKQSYYMQQVFPWTHSSPERKRHLDRFRIFCGAH